MRVGNEPDAHDGERVKWAKQKWHAQDDVLRLRDRQVEENVLMISGQHWHIFDPIAGRWLDPTEWMSSEERRWRLRPVVNYILPWFMTTHARLTENQPIITFVPGPDRDDAIAAEMLDQTFKTLWREIGMPEIHDRAMSWMIPGGVVYQCTRFDLTRGELKPWVGPGEVPVVGPDGQPQVGEDGQPETMEHPEVPFDSEGNPQMVMTPDGPMQTGEPHATREGEIVVDVLSPLEVRGEWGPTPWHLKRWHMSAPYMSVAEIRERYQLEVTPDATFGSATDAGFLRRLTLSAGAFGAASQLFGSESRLVSTKEGFARCYTLWEAPCDYPSDPTLQGYAETPQSPGGRLLIVVGDKVAFDGPRPVAFKYTSPIRQFGFVRIPGRPHDSSPQEMLNELVRANNRRFRQILEHANLCTNPIGLVDKASGLGTQRLTNEPGKMYQLVKRPGIAPMEFVVPPPLGTDTYRASEMLMKAITDLGQLHGSQGEMPSRDASGELVKELRFNSDRYLGPTARRMVEEYGRMAEDWKVLIAAVWPAGKVLQYTGDDNIARTLAVLPQMFDKTKVNCVPDVESMLPEGRGERQQRITWMYGMGLFGPPGSPEAMQRYFDMARFPNLNRAAKPGGVDRTMAEQLLGAIVQGATIDQIPYFPWYDETIHLMVFEQFMKGPEFLRLPPPAQQTLQTCHARYQFMAQQKLMQQMQMQYAMQAASGQVQPPPPEGGPGGKGSGGGSSKAGKAPGTDSRPTSGAASEHGVAPNVGPSYPAGLTMSPT